MLSKLRSRKGFTLIELMIVVAIIGILAAIAIPNFLKFQAKSKTSEAKTNLKAIYTAETAYYSEENEYGNFDQINWIPAGKNLIYSYSLDGDPDDAAQDDDGIIQTSNNGLHIKSTKGFTADMLWDYDSPPFPVAGTADGTVDVDEFWALAAGVVSPRSTIADCWIINDNNILQNTQNGV